MPCQFRIDRVRARYTRVHKALAWLRDSIDSSQFQAALAGRGKVVHRVKPYMDITVWLEQKLKRTYIVTVTERKAKLWELVDDNLKTIVDKMFYKFLGDELLELRGTWGAVDRQEADDGTGH